MLVTYLWRLLVVLFAYISMKWKRKLLLKTNNAKKSENQIPTFTSKEQAQCVTPSYAENDDESTHFRPLVASSEAIREVVSDQLCREAPLSNSRFDFPFQGSCNLSNVYLLLGFLDSCFELFFSILIFSECESEDQSSGSSSLKCKSMIDTSCDAFSRYSQLCARNVLARSSLNSPEVGNYSNFRMVQQSDFEVFGKYSELCQRNTRATIGTLSVDVVHTINVRDSQTIFDESLRLNLTEEVADTSLPKSTRISFLKGDQNNTYSSTPFISEDCGHIGDPALTTRKRTQRNVASEESPSKRVRQSTPIVRNRPVRGVMRDNEEGCSSG
ncbi:hypothetical protein Tco_1361851 [Tanacetum coccineum]